MKNFVRRYGVLLLSVVMVTYLLTSCNKKEDEIINPKYYIDNSEIKTLTSAELDVMFQSVAGMSSLGTMKDVTIYKINYKTAYLGDTITASGVVCIPDTENNLGVISYQHGTITSDSDAPSRSSYTSIDDANTAMAMLSGTGFVVGLPDFIGFGSSSSKFHPYMHKETAANSVADFVHAMIEFVKKEKKASLNDNLFLSGYSQGGHVTLAAMKELEDRNEVGYIPNATSCGGSPIDLVAQMDFMVGQEVYDQPHFVPYVLKSYQSVGIVDASMDMGLVFKSPYDSKIETLYSGSYSGAQINAQLTEVNSALYTSDFINNYKTGDDYAEIITALEENSIEPWSLKTRLKLFHGTSDDLISSNQSVIFMNELNTMGSGSKVSYQALNGYDHISAAIPWSIQTIIWFKTLNI